MERAFVDRTVFHYAEQEFVIDRLIPQPHIGQRFTLTEWADWSWGFIARTVVWEISAEGHILLWIDLDLDQAARPLGE